MTTHSTRTGLQLRSLARANGQLELSLVSVPLADPLPDEVLVRIDASPLNPSDLGLLFAGADMSTATYSGTTAQPVVTATIPPSGWEPSPVALTNPCRSATRLRASSSPPEPPRRHGRCWVSRWPSSAGRCTHSTAASRPDSAWYCPKARLQLKAPHASSIRSPRSE